MPVKTRRGSQTSLNGVKRSHLRCGQVTLVSSRGMSCILEYLSIYWAQMACFEACREGVVRKEVHCKACR